MQSLKCVIIVIMVIILGSGCVIMGKDREYHPFNSEDLEKLAPGQATATEVTKAFGAPTQVVRMSNGNAYVYKRSLSKATGLSLVLFSMYNIDKQYDQLVFFFDNNDVLTHYGVSLNAGEVSYGHPF